MHILPVAYVELKPLLRRKKPKYRMTSNVGKFLILLKELQKIDAEFPLQYAICLGEISQQQGLSLTQLSDRTGMPISTVSRIISALSKNRNKGRSYGLVRVAVAPQEKRRKELYLTARGNAVMQGIGQIIEQYKDQ